MGSDRQPGPPHGRTWRFNLGRGRATLRIAWDLLRTVVAPPLSPPSPLVLRDAARRAADTRGSADRRDGPLRLVMWNIHRAYDAGSVAEGLANMIRVFDPDLVLLQEVPVSDPDTPWEGLAIAECLAGFHLAWAPMHRVLRPSPYYPFHASGQLTASRVDIDAAEVLPLPQVSRRKLGRRHLVRRVALVTRHTAPQPFTVANLHLENTARPSGRATQMQIALEAVADARRVVLAGDLNTALGRLEKAGRNAVAEGFHEIDLGARRFALDRVFVRGFGACEGRVLAVAGSDHRPVAVELQFK